MFRFGIFDYLNLNLFSFFCQATDGDSVGSDTSPPKGGSVESSNAGKNKLKEKMDCLKKARDEKLKVKYRNRNFFKNLVIHWRRT